jgi:hypothetical protein
MLPDFEKLRFAQFVHVTMAELEGAMTTETSLATLFAKFDPGNTGRIPLSALLHLLCETETPSALSIEEVNELLKMTGILTEMQAKVITICVIDALGAAEVAHAFAERSWARVLHGGRLCHVLQAPIV